MTIEKQVELSEEEAIKERSAYLRGQIVEALADDVTGSVPAPDGMLLKFHGTYQQDDRDVRSERLQQKLEPAYSFMIRVRMPGGVCTPAQWLALDEVARQHADYSLRITTRQTLQYHGVLKRKLKAAMAGINRALFDSIAACGDVNRNVVCHNNPWLSPLHDELHAWSRRLSDALLPKMRAYHEIWLDGEKVAAEPEEEQEPLYGATYLPRKFKIGLALPPHNDIDVFAQDLGFIAIVADKKLAGFNVSVGGGMGTTHNNPATYPRLANVIGFVLPEQLLQVAENVISVQRDFGDRTNRKHARFKYTLDDRGLDWFKAELEGRLGWRLQAARPFRFESTGDPLGWVQDGQDQWHLTLGVLSGRLRDTPEVAWLTGLRAIASVHQGDFRLTANQNLIIARIDDQEKPAIEKLLDEYRIPDAGRWGGLRRNALSCVPFPTCGLAMAESERWLPTLLARLEPILKKARLEKNAITLRVTGCPNGCARPFLGEIGLVGKAPGRYKLYLGAAFDGGRLNQLYRDGVNEDEIIALLGPIIERYAKERLRGEHFGDFVLRAGYFPETHAEP